MADNPAIASFLVREGHCESREEAFAILETVKEESDDLADYFPDWTKADADKLAELLMAKEDSSSDEEESRTEPLARDNEDNADEADEVQLAPGECALCERFMKLTRHHLIPKATWARIESSKHRLQSFMDSLESEQQQQTFRSIVRTRVIDVCRPCHSHIHKTHDHWTLATTYNTLDRLLDDPAIVNFAKWNHQQRVTPSNIIRSKRRVKKRK